MKLATFRPDPASAPLAGTVEGDRIRAFAHGTDGVRRVLAGTQDLASDLGSFALADVQLLAPIPHPGTIFASRSTRALQPPEARLSAPRSCAGSTMRAR